MKVYIKTAGFHLDTLPEKQTGGWHEVQVKEQTEVKELLTDIGLESADGITYMLNGNYAGDNTRLQEGDEILLLRMVYGG